MSSWVPRLTAPTYGTIYYVRFNYGGLNQYPDRDGQGWTLPNCTAWASGRQLENGYGEDIKPANGFGDAATWYGAAANYYDRGQDPRVGAVVVWAGGGHGAGHVAVIETYDPDTDTIVTSNSDYYGSQFYPMTLAGHNPYIGSAYTFLGYFYPAGNPKPSWYYPIICKKRRKNLGFKRKWPAV